MDFSLGLLLILFLVGFLSGFIGAIAGSGGMLTLPILLWVGVPPIAALATNKFQACFGIFSAALNYYKKGIKDLFFKSFKPLALITWLKISYTINGFIYI